MTKVGDIVLEQGKKSIYVITSPGEVYSPWNKKRYQAIKIGTSSGQGINGKEEVYLYYPVVDVGTYLIIEQKKINSVKLLIDEATDKMQDILDAAEKSRK